VTGIACGLSRSRSTRRHKPEHVNTDVDVGNLLFDLWHVTAYALIGADGQSLAGGLLLQLITMWIDGESRRRGPVLYVSTTSANNMLSCNHDPDGMKLVVKQAFAECCRWDPHSKRPSIPAVLQGFGRPRDWL
jgi:hypothetical protein